MRVSGCLLCVHTRSMCDQGCHWVFYFRCLLLYIVISRVVLKLTTSMFLEKLSFIQTVSFLIIHNIPLIIVLMKTNIRYKWYHCDCYS